MQAYFYFLKMVIDDNNCRLLSRYLLLPINNIYLCIDDMMPLIIAYYHFE